jgi:integrase
LSFRQIQDKIVGGGMLLYNVEVKKQFLDKYPEDSQPIYQRVFGKSKDIETADQKDLYEFNLIEIEKVLEVLEPKYISTSRTNGRIISAYIKWAIEQGLRADPKNPLEEVENSFFERFVDKSNKVYFSFDEIDMAENFCENAQDAVVILLLFEGVQGRENAELRNLKAEDVDFEQNTLTLTDEKEQKRTINVSARCMHLIEEALSESTYYKRNGMMDDAPSTVRTFTDLVDNDFVIRSSITKTDSINQPVDKFVIYRRVSLLGELLTIPNFNAKNISRSGMIYMGCRLLQERGKLDKVAYDKIAERFKINTMPALREIVNEETISKLYGE